MCLLCCGADPVLCKRLEEAGCTAVMPLGVPLGSTQGLQTRALLEIIIEQSRVPVAVEAGLGAPSHAAEAVGNGRLGRTCAYWNSRPPVTRCKWRRLSAWLSKQGACQHSPG